MMGDEQLLFDDPTRTYYNDLSCDTRRNRRREGQGVVRAISRLVCDGLD